jgi:hypothetical protein
MTIPQRVGAYFGGLEADKHHRYRSWEHCYQFFREFRRQEPGSDRRIAALQLGFYLASWGMYRGSSFLLQRDFTVHLDAIDCIMDREFAPLWDSEFGSGVNDAALVPIVLSAINAIREAYSSFGQPTDTLVTKILLGTIGCLPACDRYFINGFKERGFSYSYLNEPFAKRLLAFCADNLAELRDEQARIESACGNR